MAMEQAVERRNYFTKLSADDVRLIRQLHPELSYRVLAQKFDVSKRAIESIVTRQTWRHVE
jgi:hypothetical protein